MRRPTSPRGLPLIALLLTACGGVPAPRTVTAADLRSVHEARALQIVDDAVTQEGVPVASGWQVAVGADHPLRVDVRLAGTEYGIEYVSPQDRIDYGDAIPRPDPNGQLRILAGTGADARAQILVLEESSYRYDPDPDRVQAGARGVREAEGRLRRDVRDFLEYVRGQGAL